MNTATTRTPVRIMPVSRGYDVSEAAGWWNTPRPLTHQLAYTRRGLAVKATHDRSPLPEDGHFLVPVKAGDLIVYTLLDAVDMQRLGERKLSLGSHGYVQMFADGRVQLLHRWIFGVTGRGYVQIVDHVNRDRLDNRRANLRVIDGSRSNANRPQADGAYVGTSRGRGSRWRARFTWRGQLHHIGTFDDRDVAAAAVWAYRQAHCPESIPPGTTTSTEGGAV